MQKLALSAALVGGLFLTPSAVVAQNVASLPDAKSALLPLVFLDKDASFSNCQANRPQRGGRSPVRSHRSTERPSSVCGGCEEGVASGRRAAHVHRGPARGQTGPSRHWRRTERTSTAPRGNPVLAHGSSLTPWT